MGVTVHLIAHTHTDPGWLSTEHDYYTREVRPILDHVTHELLEAQNSSARTFVWSEVCFFARWYAAQSERRRRAVLSLVRSGRLEFVGGGWVQHDEALPTVGAMLEQMAEGHAWLNATFGVRPSIGWQLDVFGHSAAATAVLARMGMRAVVINRINYNLKRSWRAGRALEFEWSGVAPCLHWGDRGGVLTHALYGHYSTPKGLDFEGDGDNSAHDAAAVRQHADRLQAIVREVERAPHACMHMCILSCVWHVCRRS